MRSGATAWGWVLAAAVLCSSFVWWHQDDLYIHLQYARQLGESGQWSFRPGHPTYGTTSPLWVLLMAGIGRAGGNLLVAAKAVSVAGAVLSVWLVARYRGLFDDAGIGRLCLLSLVLNHWIRLAAGSGMEATLAGCLVLWLGLLLLRPLPRTVWAHAGLGVLAGAVVLVRPEFFVLPLFLLADGGRTLRERAARLAGALVPILPWAAFAVAEFGTLVPNTVVVKSLMVDPWSAVTPARLLRSLARLAWFYGPSNLVELAGLGLYAWLGVRAGRRREPVTDAAPPGAPRSLWLLLALLPGIYFFNQARGGEMLSYRYAAPTLPLLIVLGWRGYDAWMRQARLRPSTRRALGVVLGTAAVAGNVALSALHTPCLVRSVRYVEGTLVAYGKRIRADGPEGAVVAAYDVGAVAYHSRHPVLDLVGLNSDEVIRLRRSAPREYLSKAAIEAFRPTYLVTAQDTSLPDYERFLPPFETVMKREVAAYRFSPASALRPPRHYPVHLLRLAWPSSRTAAPRPSPGAP